MKPGLDNIYLSYIDEERFGIRTARATDVTLAHLPQITDFCKANNVVLLIARCHASELKTAQAMEQDGFMLMDTLVYYKRSLGELPVATSRTAGVRVRSIRPGEEEQVKQIAAEAFRGYLGHYHADSRLDRTKCDEVYTSWAFNLCVSRNATNEVLVADYSGTVVGFVALRQNSPVEGEGVLNGVAVKFQGRGIYGSLISGGLEWCSAQGAQDMIISTQITNNAAQKVWVRQGFEPLRAYFTFHRWFDQS